MPDDTKKSGGYDQSVVDRFVKELRGVPDALVAFWALTAFGGVVEGTAGEWAVRFAKLPGNWYRANVLFALRDDLVRINTEMARGFAEKAREAEGESMSLTKMQKETLNALYDLARKKYWDLPTIVGKRLQNRRAGGDFSACASHARYRDTTRKLCEELSRRGYADQQDATKSRPADQCGYKITVNGQKKVKKWRG